MTPFPENEHQHLVIATGWMELGNVVEANEELDKISPSLRAHPFVLDVRWQIYALAKKWEACVDLAEALVKLVPNQLNGWLHRSYALHSMKRTQEAFDRLLPARDMFPNEQMIPYNLACYSCQLGRLEEARKWLALAFEIGGKEIKLMALDDPDLEPLWRESGNLG